MPFDAAPSCEPRRERLIVFAVKAPDLKTVIVDCALAGTITTAEAEDLISEHGLRHD